MVKELFKMTLIENAVLISTQKRNKRAKMHMDFQLGKEGR
jgi:hypothetical protein